jgi:hypothetical protein
MGKTEAEISASLDWNWEQGQWSFISKLDEPINSI